MGAKIGIINGFDKCFDFNFKADTLIFFATNTRIFFNILV